MVNILLLNNLYFHPASVTITVCVLLYNHYAYIVKRFQKHWKVMICYSQMGNIHEDRISSHSIWKSVAVISLRHRPLP